MERLFITASSNNDLFFSIVSIPPIPAPKLTPTLVKSILESRIPECSID